jgi:ribonuclease HI
LLTELWSLLRGIKIATDHDIHQLIVEGDSQIIIQLITKIIHGSHPLEVSPSWRLSGLLEDFKSFLQPNLTLIPSHVKREANKIVEFLENEGVDSMDGVDPLECTNLSSVQAIRLLSGLSQKGLFGPRWGAT